MPARVGTTAYSCKTQAVRAGMRLPIAVEHPGDLLLTVTEFFRILHFRAEKKGYLWFPVLFLEYLFVAVFPSGSQAVGKV